LGFTPRFIKSGGGVFEVNLNGDIIFSKRATGRFPEAGEVMGELKSRL
jgi:selT/selW/selH-like putative selenoprotein